MNRRKKIFLFVCLGLLGSALLFTAYFFLSLPEVALLKKENPKTTSMIQLRKKEAAKAGKSFYLRWQWIPFNAVPDLLKKTVIVSEDAAFYQHDGIDYYELKEAFKRNLRDGKKARGGSTITQQLAKNLFLSTEKSYYRKIREMVIAKRLEKYLSKDRIFCIYLNVIELGPGIFGVEAAAQYFFKKSTSFLNLVEMVRLVSVMPKPLKVSPLSDSKYLKWRALLILKRLLHYRHISNVQFEKAQAVFK